MRVVRIALPVFLLSASALAADPPSAPPAQPPQAPQFSATAEGTLASIGLNALMSALNAYREKISCPASPDAPSSAAALPSCDLVVHIERGQLTSVSQMPTEPQTTPNTGPAISPHVPRAAPSQTPVPPRSP